MSIIYINPYRFAAASAYDPDAQSYITAVEAADGQSLEVGVKNAINAFVVGCKSDGIWSAIKASCILAGARTLAGALVPLVGTAPTNFNFVAGDYNRKTGLVGNGSTKYLDSNRAGDVDPQDSYHIAGFVTNAGSGIMSDRPPTGTAGSQTTLTTSQTTSRGTSGQLRTSVANSLYAINRSSSSAFSTRAGNVTVNETGASIGVSGTTVKIFVRGDVQFFSNSRFAFYSIGESLDLALLDARVTALVNAIGAAIP